MVDTIASVCSGQISFDIGGLSLFLRKESILVLEV